MILPLLAMVAPLALVLGAPVTLALCTLPHRAAGNLMYFGGDIAELALALALLVTWRPAPRSVSRPVPAPVQAP